MPLPKATYINKPSTQRLCLGSHLVLLILVLDLEVLGGADHGLHGGEDILVDQFSEAALVLIRVACAMDNAHLLDEGTLATLARAWRRTHTHTHKFS